MGDGECTFGVHRQAVRSNAAGQPDECADLKGRAISMHRNAPDSIVARHIEENGVLASVDNKTVRTWHTINHDVEPSIAPQAEEAAVRIVQTTQSLVGKVEITVIRKAEVIETIERLTVVAVHDR